MKRYWLRVNGSELELFESDEGAFVSYSDALAAQAADKERIKKLEEALREIEGLSGLDNEIASPMCSVIVADRMASIHQIAGSNL